MLALMDTATGKVAPLEPRDPGRLSVYLCGPTVAGLPHLGHGRFSIVWDAFRRYLTWTGVEVRFVSNVTDIEDKIIARAAQEGSSVGEVASRYEATWFETMERLGVQRPDEVPHATAYVGHMVDLIARLTERGHAYVASDGVYFSTASLPGYGLLARQDLSMLKAGARVEVAEEVGKRSPLDFVLWKLTGEGPGDEPSWPSPWGKGRPGWHTECVVMSTDLLGDEFDLHLGGLDLAFPHHENERAQAVASGRAFARRWAHNGLVTDDGGEKMSRSVGNVTSLQGVLERYEGRVLRYLVLQAHYRSPQPVSEAALESAKGALARLDNFAREAKALAREAKGPVAASPDAVVIERFKWRMDDDLDTPGALAVVFGAVRDARADPERAPALASAVLACCRAVGLELAPDDEAPDQGVEAMVARRDEARRRRDYAEADSIRGELVAMGYTVEDGPSGTVARRDH